MEVKIYSSDEIAQIAEEAARRVLISANPDIPVTLKRASALTGIPVETLDKWVTQGRLRTYPCVGRLRMVKVSDITWEE